MPDKHALLGPSGAHRWMICTPSAKLEAGLPDRGSEYAREGTLAHRLGELLLRERWEGADVTEDLAVVQSDPLYNGTMGELVEGYADTVSELMAEAAAQCPDPRLFIEQRLDLAEYIPESFGTSDAVIVADGLLTVVDLKYGTGVPVSAEGNPQMRIYALGAYSALNWAYRMDRVRAVIYQPRLDRVSVDEMDAADLLRWAEEELRPRAVLAWEGRGEFVPGESQCRFCRAKAVCRARAEYQTELARRDFAPPDTLTGEEIAEILKRLPDFRAWASAVEEYALDAAVNQGAVFPGFKVVEGRSNRRYGDENAVAAALRRAGFRVEDIYKPRELLGITAMEKLVGKKKFGEIAGGYVIKPEGAPTLVPESDKRPALNTAAKAAADFKEE